ncbi:hypothetical protein [Sporosarcina jiandibaonis]|uniref:hypothetical protein n=1 Tax=Sporosarcina jiandibaonis TaxID=2715535 RepID=UPI001555C046|nr:hypothetical protein [Sporosarcina jiandibaonis]
MGLFINNKKHPAIYKNHDKLTEPNQAVFKQDYLSELIEKQNRANAELQNSLQTLEKSLKKQNRLQATRVKRISYDVRELADRQFEQIDIGYDVTNLLETQSKRNAELAVKMEQQMELQRDMVQQIANQESFQQEVINRLENQEALTEKLMRKVDNFRSILYERTHFLADKIEEGYTATSTYVHELVSSTALPPLRYKLKDSEKKVD